MRLLVNCPSGASHLLQLDTTTKILELKKVLQDLEGIAANQQVITFAGQDCKDHLTVEDYKFGLHSLSDEVVLYLSTRLAEPKLIYLCARQKPSQLIPENVECSMTLKQVMGLLESRNLSTSFKLTAGVIAKRGDGTTVHVTIDPEISVDQLERQLCEKEGVAVTRMSFQQAQDGHMHVIVFPSTEASTNTHPVYARSTKVQEVMLERNGDSGMKPLTMVIEELCVLP